MYRREWIPKENNTHVSASKITIYDAGAFIYELLEIEGESSRLFCWEVLNREQDGNKIVETLKSVPGDWVPFDLISSETYSLKLIDSGYEIPGWTILNISRGLDYLNQDPTAQRDQRDPRGQKDQRDPRGQRDQGQKKQALEFGEQVQPQLVPSVPLKVQKGSRQSLQQKNKNLNNSTQPSQVLSLKNQVY